MDTKPSKTHFLSGKHIIVSGGGLAGLSFVRALNRAWPLDAKPPKVTLYERDTKEISSAREGYSLGIRSDPASGGMQALRTLGLLEATLEASADVGLGNVIIRDPKWNTLIKFKHPEVPPMGLPYNSFRIPRYALRKCLINGLPDSCDAHWKLGCVGASRLNDGRMKVELSDGSTDECDLLIVADGANSKIRASLRPDDTLQYQGVNIISGVARFPGGKCPEQVRDEFGPLLGGDGSSAVVFPMDEQNTVWHLSRLSEIQQTPISGQDAVSRKDEILDRARQRAVAFTEPMGELIDNTDPTTLKVFNAMDKPPIPHQDITHTPAIYIGDANHAVSPYAGAGANMAFLDSVSLAESLCKAVDLESAVEAFDKESMPRCQGALKKSHILIPAFHSTGWRFQLWILVFKVFFLFLRLKNVSSQSWGKG